MATSSEWTDTLVFVVALGAFCNGLLWGGILWRIVPFPTWETIRRAFRRARHD